jgi:hypothetical protein
MPHKNQTRPISGRVGCDMLGRPSQPHPIILGVLRHPANRLLTFGFTRAGQQQEGCAFNRADSPLQRPLGRVDALAHVIAQ